MAVLEYGEVEERVKAAGDAAVLLGNGFSIGFDERFRYDSLFAKAEAAGLSETARALFDRVGKGDFEGALRLLDDGEWVAQAYGATGADLAAMRADAKSIRDALAAAVRESHLDHAGELPLAATEAASRFLGPYRLVFTTNYDLLLYWVVMSMEPAKRLDDGFRAAGGDPVFVGWKEDRQMFHVHGALHLYWEGDGLKKHSWHASGQRLKDAIAQGLEGGRYPHFVAEGFTRKKLAKIRRSPYLNACYEHLAGTGPVVVVLGLSFADNDTHLARALAGSSALEHLYVGLHGDPESPANRDIATRVKRAVQGRPASCRALSVAYFDSASVPVWSAAVGR